jgi:hypothetical protein
MALAIGSIVVQANYGPFGEVIVPYGWITGGSADSWSVLWSHGAFTLTMDDDLLVELVPPYQVGDLLGRRVRPNRAVDPRTIGGVVLQDANNILIVEAPIGTYAIAKANCVEDA